MIHAEELTKYYGQRKALDGLSFTVGDREIVGLVGRNGAGKSTALRILSCQLLPSGGQVEVDGLSVTEQPLEVRRRIGFLPETPPLYPEMTVSAYLTYAARLRGVARETVLRRVPEVMGQTGLRDVSTERVGNLSRGFQQRVGIAQAIVHDPSVVLLDEPMAGLDPLQISQMRELIRALKAQHTVLFSSHILSEIASLCDRIVVIDQGRLRAEGSEQALWQRYLSRQRLRVRVRGSEDALRKSVAGLGGDAQLEGPTVGEDKLLDAVVTSTGDVREALANALIGAGLGLLELREERHGLEDLFMQLLQGETAQGETAQSGAAS